MELFDDNTMIGTPQSISAGSATFSISNLDAGQYNNLYVTYLGDDSDAPSQSTTLSLTILQRAITVTAAADTKTYDGTTTSTGVPIITGGLAPGDVAAFSQAFGSRNAVPRTLTASGTRQRRQRRRQLLIYVRDHGWNHQPACHHRDRSRRYQDL